MTTVLFSGTVIASFLAGMVALFAPCCISVMLPAYFASSFERRRALVAMTFLFAAGVSLVILPIALGAAAIGAAINEQHLIVYLAGGGLMVALGLFILAGGKLRMPMPGLRARGGGPLAVVTLGAFSGVASACCAPVLAGVLALAGASASFSAALVLGVAYVFGMVFPLFAIALLWDRFNWGESRLLRGRRFALRVVGRELSLHTTALASGVLLVGMGAFAVAIAFSGNTMPSSGWQVELSARVQHWAHVVTEWLQTAPGWITSAALVALLAWLAWKALGQAGMKPAVSTTPSTREPTREESIEWQNS
ncbi:MAG: cytochrome c biogenesis CcdA family protein [Thermoleophilaceae bacterium]